MVKVPASSYLPATDAFMISSCVMRHLLIIRNCKHYWMNCIRCSLYVDRFIDRTRKNSEDEDAFRLECIVFQLSYTILMKLSSSSTQFLLHSSRMFVFKFYILVFVLELQTADVSTTKETSPKSYYRSRHVKIKFSFSLLVQMSLLF